MNDVIAEVRRLKSEAMDARDGGNVERAINLLEAAEVKLLWTLNELKEKRDPAEPAGRQETEVANQLVHILGSKGGVYRRCGKYEAAAKAYDAGYEFERPEARYGIVNSYNLVQRLVARVFLEPRAVAEESLWVEDLAVHHELFKARQELQRQIEGPRRDDEYAMADLATVQLLLGDVDWSSSLDGFVDSKPEPYAVQVTLELFEMLSKSVAAKPSAPSGLAERLSEAVARLQSSVPQTLG